MESKFVEMNFSWFVGVLFSLEYLGRLKRPLFLLIFFFSCFGEQFSLTRSWLFYGCKKYIGLFICCNYNNIAIGVQLGNKSGHSFLPYTNN